MTATVGAPATASKTDTTYNPSDKPRFGIGRALAWAFMILVILASLFPFYWMLRTALSNGKSLPSNPSSLLPADFTLGAFKRVLGLSTVEQAQAEGGSGADINFWLYLRNSVIVSVVITAGQVFFCSMAAYAFAAISFRGRGILFGILLATLIIPFQVVLVPNFILWRMLPHPSSESGNFIGTQEPLWVGAFFGSAFGIFLLRQFFLAIPVELADAA